MAESKWLVELDGETPLADAARQVLAERLRLVPERLAGALYEPDRDLEHVHQLRVATRRAGAALAVFEVCLPARDFERARRRLRRLRRAAGAARDADVFMQTIATRSLRARPAQRSGLDYLLGYAGGQRLAAQRNLVRATRRKPRDWRLYFADVLDAVAQPAAPRTLGELARPHLARLIADLENAAHQDLHEYGHLHQVRILGKQLRYAMEIFAGCHDADFRERFYPAIVAMQEILGNANDSYVAAGRLSEIRASLEMRLPRAWKRLGPGLEALLRFHERRLPACRRQFDAWWHGWLELNMIARFQLYVA